MSAAIARLPAITSAIVAATPIRGGPTVIARTMKALSMPPVQSQTGWRAAAPIPLKLRLTTRSAVTPMTAETIVENGDGAEDADAIAELAHDGGLHGASEPGGEGQRDREGAPGGHRPTISLPS